MKLSAPICFLTVCVILTFGNTSFSQSRASAALSESEKEDSLRVLEASMCAIMLDSAMHSRLSIHDTAGKKTYVLRWGTYTIPLYLLDTNLTRAQSVDITVPCIIVVTDHKPFAGHKGDFNFGSEDFLRSEYRGLVVLYDSRKKTNLPYLASELKSLKRMLGFRRNAMQEKGE